VIRRWFEPARSKVLLGLGGPIILGMASQIITNLVDTAMVGRLGAAPQAAAGLASFAFWVAANLIIGIGTGVQATVSRRDGEGDTEEVGAALDTGLVLAVVLGLPLGYGLAMGAGFVLPLLTDDAEVIAGGSGYLAIRLMGLGAVATNYCFRGFYNGIGQSKVYMTSLAAIHATNIFLNWVFIYGNLGARPMGVQGAALASVLAAVTGVVFYSTMTLVRAELRTRYKPFRFRSLGVQRTLRMLRITWPEAVRGIALMMGYLLFQKLHALLGTREVAAGTILVNLSSAGFLPALGMGMACATLVGRHLGKGEPDESRRYAWLGVRLTMAGLSVPAVLAAIFAGPVLALFTSDPDVIAEAAPALRLFALTAVLDALSMVLTFSLLGAGATRFVAALQIGQQYLLLLPLAWLLGLHLEGGVFGLWVAMVLSRVLVGAIAVLKFRGDSWTKLKV
jgi:putative MATE family efflux protein